MSGRGGRTRTATGGFGVLPGKIRTPIAYPNLPRQLYPSPRRTSPVVTPWASLTGRLYSVSVRRSSRALAWTLRTVFSASVRVIEAPLPGETQPPSWRVDAEPNGWRRVHLLAGRVHCASAECHRLGPPAGTRRAQTRQDYRLDAGFGEPCSGQGGALHDRLYHWEEHDPEDHSGEPKQSHAVGLLDPDGTFWHHWCAPLEGRALFGFLRAEERSDGADPVVGGFRPRLS